MVAKIISGKSLIGALNYNENKVAKGKAELIAQNGYQKDISMLNFYDKILRLTDLAHRNERAKTNAVHISLNFAVDEKLPKEKLAEIANDYMERIGFELQPYLVYLHNDAGHPHIHIVSTNIKSTGERISLHNLGRTKSEAARKAIELNYHLVCADQRPLKQGLHESGLQKIIYGQTDTKRAITNILNEVLKSYKFTSLHELNAILNQYNVTADRGPKDSRMYARNGLVYGILDNTGKIIGVPIKASDIYGAPTLRRLNEKFVANEQSRKAAREILKERIYPFLATKSSQLRFKQALQTKGINVVYRQNQDGFLYGITFVDNNLKVVFNGSDLGKAYSAASLNESLVRQVNDQPIHKPSTDDKSSHTSRTQMPKDIPSKSFLDDLLKTEYQDSLSIKDMSQNKRKKKKKRLTR